jgi:hypothetical protein
MKVVTNTKLVEQRSKWAKRVAPLTMLFLIGGLITNFLSINQPAMFRPTLILLTLGFVSAIVSSNLVNNWVREPRADQVLEQLLKKFGNDYMLFNYTSPVRHVLLAPNSLYVILVKNVDGKITVDGRRISRKFTLRRLFRLLGDESLAAPMTDAEKQVGRLHKFLSKDLVDEEIPEIKPMILFSNKNAELTVNNPAIPVMPTKGFKSFLREEGKARNISAEQRKRLAEVLANE